MKKIPNLRWYISDLGKESIPSAAEERIIELLNTYNIEWHREVSFKRLTTRAEKELRYDFFIPSLKLLLEYDGEHHTKSPKVQNNDRWKNWFAWKHKYKLLRYNKLHWNNLEKHIEKDLLTMFKLPKPKL